MEILLLIYLLFLCIGRERRNEPEVEDINLEEIPRFGIPIIGIFLVYAAVSVGLNDLMLNLVIGGAGVLLIVIFGVLFGKKYQEEGLQEAIDYAVTAPIEEKETESKSQPQGQTTEKTPPAPESLKNELYFERADKQCEWCGKDIDSPDVHHIKPREEGGPNKPSNLIVLCPNCHRKADSGVISRSKLKYQVRKNRGEE
ncbi:MAG: HNH endonuclease [Candidatus Nanohaloarchaea archaeon]